MTVPHYKSGRSFLSIVVLIMFGIFARSGSSQEAIKLPEPQFKGQTSVEEALKSRRSVREYTDTSLTLSEISQILWAAQGKTHAWGLRTAPSAGALYPLEIFVVAGKVDELPVGVYRFRCHEHDLVRVLEGDKRGDLYRSALKQESIRDAPAVFVIASVYERVMKKYGERGIRYAHIEVGAAAENIYLQCESLGLGTVIIGAFHDDKVRKALSLKDDEKPLAIMPVGKPK